MPKKTGRPRLYANARDRKRAQRARQAASLAHQLDAAAPTVPVVDLVDPVGVLAAWAASTLVVPPGHPRAGEPMALPDFAVAWLRASCGRARVRAQYGAQEREKCDLCGNRAWFPRWTTSAPRLARCDCVSLERKGGRTSEASSADCRGVRACGEDSAQSLSGDD